MSWLDKLIRNMDKLGDKATKTMAVNPNSLEYQYRRVAGGDNNNQKATYAVEFSSGGKNYTFIPDSVIAQGVQAGNAQYVMPWFLNQDNLGKLGDVGQRVDLNGVSWYGDYFKDTVGASPTGFLIPSGSLKFDSDIKSPPLDKGRVQGVANTKEGLAYVMDTPSGALGRYIASDGKTTTLTQTGGSSLIGGVVGGWFDDLTKATGVQDVANNVNSFFQTPVGKAMLVASAAAAGGAFDGVGTAGGAPVSASTTGATAGAGAGAAGAGMLSGTDAALADLAASAPAISAPAAATGTGLLGGTATGEGINLGTGITAGSSGVGLTAGTGAANLTSMGGGTGLTTAGAGGGLLSEAGLSTGAAAAGGIGAGIGTSAAASGTGSLLGSGAASSPASATAAGAAAGAAGAGATLGDLSTASLIKGGLALTGGLLQGDTNKDAAAADLAARTTLADKAAEMGKFTPVGITTTFGTSNFVTDPKTGAITPSYTLSPTAAGYQKSLSALGNTALSSASNIMKLGNQYINESPEAVRNRYISTQRGLLAPGQEQQLAGIRTNLANTGRSGLALGATSDGMLATNPELAAYYNSLAMTNRGIAADAETNYKNQVNFGTGLLGSAITPFTNVFNASTGVETAAQKPLELSTNFANTAASRGAANAANYVNTINPGLSSTYNANTYNPWATALSGMSDSDLAVWGLKKLIP